MRTHYEVLGVPRDASLKEVISAYRALSRTVHPDRGGDVEEMTRVNLARDVLCSPTRRKDYDASLARPSAAPEGEPAPAPEPPGMPEPSWGSPVGDTGAPSDRDEGLSWGMESTAPTPSDGGWGQEKGAFPLNWTPPPIPEYTVAGSGVSKALRVAAWTALAMLVALVATGSLGIARGVPGGGTLFVSAAGLGAAGSRRALSTRARTPSVVAEILCGLGAFFSVGMLSPAVLPSALGLVGLAAVPFAVVVVEWMRSRRRRHAAALAVAARHRQHAEQVRALAVQWHQMLRLSLERGHHLRWVDAAQRVGAKTHMRLVDTRTYVTTQRWVWDAWDPKIWVVLNTTDQVAMYAPDAARAAWEQIGPQ